MKKINFIIIFFLFPSLSIFAQIPNNDFENWTNMGSYFNPDNWDTFNDTSSLAGVFTCTKGTPGTSGSTYIKLTTLSIPFVTTVPGIAVCGTINISTLSAGSGFPFTGRPQAITGDWQYMPSGSDGGFIAVILTKWNSALMSTDTIATLYEALQGSVTSWAAMNLPLTYQSNLNPDTAVIILAASGATGTVLTANSYLYVDNLSFTGNVSGISNTPDLFSFTTYPNPVKDLAHFTIESNDPAFLQINDLTGRIVYSSAMQPENGIIIFDASFLKAGHYSVLISDEKTQRKSEIIKIE